MIGMHQKTVYHWVRSGKLPAVASPGGMLRVRAEDARALCHKSGLAVPEQIASVPRRVVLVERDKSVGRVLGRSLKGKGFEVLVLENPYEAFVAIVKDPPEVLVIDPRSTEIDALAMVAALQSDERTKHARVYGWGEPLEEQEGATFAGFAPRSEVARMSSAIG